MHSIDRGRAVIWSLCAIAVLALGGRWLIDSASAPASSQGWTAHNGTGRSTGAQYRQAGSSQGPASSDVGSAASAQVIVHVAGFVHHPGVYRFAAGSRVYQALDAAGGASSPGDANAIDLAARLVDGSQLIVPKRGSRPQSTPISGAGVGGAGSGGSPSSSGPISLNQATVDQLDMLDGIGPALAARIVAWRESHGGFKGVDDLDNVPGIGPARLDALRGSLTP